MNNLVKSLITSVLPIVLILGGGYLAYQYYTQGLEINLDEEKVWLKTYLGRDPYRLSLWLPDSDNPDLQFSGRLPIWNSQYALRRKGSLEKLIESIEQASISKKDSLSQLHLLHSLQQEIQRLEAYQTIYPLAPKDGQHIKIEELLLYLHPIRNGGDCEAYLKRLNQLPQIIQGWESDLLDRAKAERLPHREVLELNTQQFMKGAKVAAKAHPIYQSLARRAGQADMVNLDEYTILDFLEQTEAVLQNGIQPALVRLARVCDSLAQLAPQSVCDTDQAFYQQQLATYSAFELEPDSLLSLVEKDVSQWAELYQTHLGKVPSQDPTFTSSEPELDKVLEAWFKQRVGIKTISRGLVDSLASSRLRLAPNYDHRMSSAEVRYLPADLNQTQRASRLWVDLNLPNHWSEDLRTWQTYRWITPGLDLFWSRQLQAGQRPALRRLTPHPAIMEGWARYAVYLMDHDLHLIPTRPELQSIYLERQLKMCLLAWADLRLHHLHQNYDSVRAELASYFDTPNHGLHSSLEGDLVQVAAAPGQALAAWSGFRFLLELREIVAAKHPDSFYLQGYHDALLFEGAIHPRLLKEVIPSRYRSIAGE